MGVSGIRGQMSEVRGVGARFIAPCVASREATKGDVGEADGGLWGCPPKVGGGLKN